jgi:hypothetical protein
VPRILAQTDEIQIQPSAWSLLLSSGGLGFRGKGIQYSFKLFNQIAIRQLAAIDIEVIEKAWNAEAANDLATEKRSRVDLYRLSRDSTAL